METVQLCEDTKLDCFYLMKYALRMVNPLLVCVIEALDTPRGCV